MQTNGFTNSGVNRMSKAVLLDSGVLIRLMNPYEPLHQVALGLFRNYVNSGIVCKVSTIALAEYGVKGDLHLLPSRYLQYVPFMYLPNDTKMFAQASADPEVSAFVSADAEAKKVYDLLENPNFDFLNIREL